MVGENMKKIKVLITPEQITGEDGVNGLLPNEYAQNIKCGNCGRYFLIAIKKGVMVSEEISQAPCPNCGCEWLQKSVK